MSELMIWSRPGDGGSSWEGGGVVREGFLQEVTLELSSEA